MRHSSQVKPIGHRKANAAEVLALLKILALGDQDLAAGKVRPVAEVVARRRARRSAV